MGLPMQRMHRAYFGLQKVKGLQQFKVKSEQYIESQLQGSLPHVDATRFTSARVAIRIGV